MKLAFSFRGVSRRRLGGLSPFSQKPSPSPLNPQMKWHFVQGLWRAAILSPGQPPPPESNLPPPHFEMSGFAPVFPPFWHWIDYHNLKPAHYFWRHRGPAPFHRLTPNKRFEPVFSTVIMAMCSLFNRTLLLTDLIPVHLLYCGQTVMIGCNHTSFEWTRAVRHIYDIIRHMQGLYKLENNWIHILLY